MATRSPIIERAVALPPRLATDTTRLEFACYAHKAVFDQMLAGESACKTEQERFNYRQDALARLCSVSAVLNQARARFPALLVGDMQKGNPAWVAFKGRARGLTSYRALIEAHPIFRPTPVAVPMVDPYVDFESAGWNETDPATKITRATTTITAVMGGAGAARVDRDYGAAHFGTAFTHTHTCNWSATTGGTVNGVHWAVSNVLASENDWWTNKRAAVGAALLAVSYRCLLIDFAANTYDTSNQVPSFGNLNFSTVRSGAGGVTLTQTITGTLSDVLVSTCPASVTYQHLVPANEWGSETGTSSYTVTNLDLHEAVAATPWLYAHRRNARMIGANQT